MGERNTHDELLVHVQYIRESVDGINERLDRQNGRLRLAETDIAILKDRQSDARKTGGAWGAGGGLLGGFIAGFVQHFFSGK